ncbi:hypothetical protein KR074_005038 [Drosophila pseudoananassae]|nr:hypothetical protein KR074_005038 [Drosophila pseudoananassae]
MEIYRDRGVLMFTLLMALPLRMLLYAAYLYLQNLTTLLHMIEILLLLMMDGLFLVCRIIRRRIIHTTRQVRRQHFYRHLLFLLRIHNRIIGFTLIIHRLAKCLTIVCTILNRLSKIFRVCAHRRTWELVLHDSGII